MATRLYLRTSFQADVDAIGESPGTSGALNLAGTAQNWFTNVLSTTPGTTVQTPTANTVTGPTNGVDSTTDWISPPLAAAATISGTITANCWASESSMNANVAINVVIEILRADGTITQIVKSTRTTEVAITTNAVNNFTTGMVSGGYTAQTAQKGDRIRARFFGDDAGTMASGFTFQYSYGTSGGVDGDTWIEFTENLTFADSKMIGTTVTFFGGTAIPIGDTSANTRIAYSFVPDVDSYLWTFRLPFTETGAVSDGLTVGVWSDSSGSPNALIGSSHTKTAADLSSSGTFWPEPGILTGGTTYWIVVERTGAFNNTLYRSWRRESSSTLPGVAKIYNGSSWGDAANPTFEMSHYLRSFPASGGSLLYLTDTASAVATASVDREAWTSKGGATATDVTNTAAGWTSPIQVTDTAGGTVVDWFTKPLTAFTLSGLIYGAVWSRTSNGASKAMLRCEVARVNNDGTSPTIWGSFGCVPSEGGYGLVPSTSIYHPTPFCISGDDLSITNGQRLRIRLYVDDNTEDGPLVTGHTVTISYGNVLGDRSFFMLPQTVTESTGAVASLLYRRRPMIRNI